MAFTTIQIYQCCRYFLAKSHMATTLNAVVNDSLTGITVVVNLCRIKKIKIVSKNIIAAIFG